jgi:hypothetical protein
VSGLLERIDEVRAGETIVADCPACGYETGWWAAKPGLDSTLGVRCTQCDFNLNLDIMPPDIMCSVCGDVLQKSGNAVIVFRCQGCDRTVTA